MKQKRSKLTMWMPLAVLSIVGVSLGVMSCNDSNAQDQAEKKAGAKVLSPTKVLYVTFEPGKYHKYTPQMEVFKEVAKVNAWDATVITGTHDGVIKQLAENPNFAEGYDVVVYNFCFANCANLDVPYNIIEQTKTKGVPAMLIHCSLHSFWPTYKVKGGSAVHAPGAHEKAHTKKELLAKWNKEHPGVDFPAWPKFTGIASTGHGPQAPIQTRHLVKDHPIVKDVPEYKTVNAELYNNFINADDSKDTVSIIKGQQGKGSAVVLWEHPVGKSKVVSFTLGHGLEEWSQLEFRQIIANGVNYLAKNPTSTKK